MYAPGGAGTPNKIHKSGRSKRGSSRCDLFCSLVAKSKCARQLRRYHGDAVSERKACGEYEPHYCPSAGYEQPPPLEEPPLQDAAQHSVGLVRRRLRHLVPPVRTIAAGTLVRTICWHSWKNATQMPEVIATYPPRTVMNVKLVGTSSAEETRRRTFQ